MEEENKAEAVGVSIDNLSEMSCEQCSCEIDVSGFEPFTKIECPDCGSIETVHGKLGSFILMDLLGTGGMGGVYKGKDEFLGRLVAIKVMLKSLGENVEFIETFKREAQASAKLNHPNIAQIYSFGQEKGQPYIVMELVQGSSLHSMMEEGKELDQGVVMRIGLEIARALKAADDAGLVHGDIKPENILLDENDNAKLVDFGLASFAHQAAADGIWGTPYYIAPEKVRRKKADARSDIYSLGATLYHALTLKPPFDGETATDVVKARLMNDPAPLSRIRGNIKQDVERIVLRMLQQEPNQRHPTYASLIGDLKKVVRQLGGGQVSKRSKKTIIAKSRSGSVVRSTGIKSRTGLGSNTGIRSKTGIRSSTGIRSRTGVRAGTRTNIRVRAGGSNTARYKIPKKSGVTTPTSTKAASSAVGNYVANAAAAPKKPKSKAGKWIGFIIFLLIALGGAGYFFKTKHDKEIARRQEYVSLQDQMKFAADRHAEIGTVVSNVYSMAEVADGYKKAADDAVFAVLEEHLNTQAPEKKEPTKEEPKPKSAPKKKAAASKAKKAGNDVGLPAGMPTREELDRQRNKKKKPEPKSEPEPEPEVEEPPAAASPADDEPKVKTLAKDVVKYCNIVAEKIAAAEVLYEESQAIVNIVAVADDPATPMTSIEASEKVAELTKKLEKAKKTKELAGTALEYGKKQLDKTEAIKKEVIEEREAQKQAEEEARKQAEEDARKREEAKEHAALVESEAIMAATAHVEIRQLLNMQNYKGALEALTSQLPNYQTDEGKAKIQIFIDRCTYLVDMQNFIITRLSKQSLKWGWIQGVKQDVLGATEEGVKLRAGVVPWSDVKVAQMLKFVSTYTADKYVRIKDQSILNIGAAIYCFENGGDENGPNFFAGAQQRVVSFSQEAAKLGVKYGDILDRLLQSTASGNDLEPAE